MRMLRFSGLLLVLALLFPALHTSAKGRPDKVVLSGPGIKEPVEIVDRQSLDALGIGGLENKEVTSLDKVPAVAEGYDLVRYIEQESGSAPIAFDHVRYFPKAADGQSYVFYIGLVQSGSSSSSDHKWFTVNPAGRTTMQHLLAKYVSNDAADSDALPFDPQSCKPGPALTDKADFARPALQLTPLTWAMGFTGPNVTLKVTPSTANAKPNERVWVAEVNWLVRKGSFYRITVWASNLENNAPVWFETGEGAPSTMLMLTPKLAAGTERPDGWIEFTSKLILPKMGCYELNVFVNGIVVPIAFATDNTH